MEINRLVLPQPSDAPPDASEVTAAKGRARFHYLSETNSIPDPREEGMEHYAAELGRGPRGDDERRPRRCVLWHTLSR